MHENETMNLGAFAWPGAVTIIVCFAMLLFRKSIRSFLARTYKIRTSGFEVAAGAQDTSKSEVGPSVANDLARQHDDPLLVEREDSIRTELGLGADHTQKETKLLGIIAAHSIALQFEKTYQNIFGSQLNALVIINAAPGGVQFGDIEDLYNQAAAQHKAFYETYNGEQWLAYMERESLSIRKDDRIHITLEGTAFLKYIIHRGYTLYKFG